ncbi:MAG: hypothetical protein IT285_11560 [Bdellovibrionales bacterium]|nr:hypothetical protein [Bdellovibrionales bacterium]
MESLRRLASPAALCASLLVVGCASSARFPVHRFHGPDTRGLSETAPAPKSDATTDTAPATETVPGTSPETETAQPPSSPLHGRAHLHAGGGTTLEPFANALTGAQQLGTEDVGFTGSLLGFGVGADHPFSDTFDAGFVIEPQAPLLLRARLQVAGPPQARPAGGEFLGTLTASLGLGVSGAGAGSDTGLGGSSDGDHLSHTSFTADFSFAGGVRLGKNFTPYLEPFLRIMSMSATLGSESLSVSAFEWGGILGARWELKQLLVFVELAYVSSSLDDLELEYLAPGLAVGLRL